MDNGILYLCPDPETAHWHNHVRKLLELAQTGKLDAPPGQVTNVEIAHDGWCALLTMGGYCDCSPTVTVRHVKGTT